MRGAGALRAALQSVWVMSSKTAPTGGGSSLDEVESHELRAMSSAEGAGAMTSIVRVTNGVAADRGDRAGEVMSVKV